MPTYEYECRSCNHKFEAFQSMSDEALTDCPQCQESQLRRLIGGGMGIIFKGSGFYVNDSRKSNSQSKSQSKPESPSKQETSKPNTEKASEKKSKKTDGKASA